MRIALFVNSAEGPRPPTTRRPCSPVRRWRETTTFATSPQATSCCARTIRSLARALTLPGRGYKKVETLHKALQSDQARIETIDVREIDVLMLRNDPSLDLGARPWAAHAGTMFGRLASRAACWS